MRIKNNISALNAQMALKINESKMTKNLEKLTSGYRINRSGDDAAGLAISEQMRSQINGLTQAEHNARDAVNLLKTGEGAMQEIHAMLIKLNRLAVQSANGVYDDDTHREMMQTEADRISEEIDRIASATRFNYVKLFQGEGPEAKSVVVTTAALAGGSATPPKKAAKLPGDTTTANDVPKNLMYTKNASTYDQTQTASVGSGSGNAKAEDLKETMPLLGISKEPDLADAQTAAASQTGAASRTAAGARTTAPAQTGTKVEAIKPLTSSGAQDTTPVPKTTTNPLTTAAPQAAAAAQSLADTPIVFQVGADKEYTISIPRFFLSKNALGLDQFDISSQEEAKISIDRVAGMIDRVSEIRGAYGAAENALEHAINSINIQKENMTAAESRIRDTDMASELTERTKNQILVQSSQSMLAQANALPEVTLQLLQRQ